MKNMGITKNIRKNKRIEYMHYGTIVIDEPELYDCLKPDQDKSSKLEIKFKLDKNKLRIMFKAKDLTALRSLLTSIVRNIEMYQKIDRL